MFLQPGNAEPTRLQGAFVSDHEVHEVVSHIKRQAPADYVDGLLSGEAAMETANAVNPNIGADDLFDRAVAFVIETRKTSISSLQRHLKIGYNRAANMMDALEEAGVVSPPTSARAQSAGQERRFVNPRAGFSDGLWPKVGCVAQATHAFQPFQTASPRTKAV